MADDDEIIETDALFTRPFRTIFGKKRHSWLRHKPKILYAALVGRNVTTDTQTLDDIVGTDGRVKVNPLSLDGLASTGSVVPSDLGVGEYFMGTNNTTDGSDATWPSASLQTTPLLEVVEMWATLDSANSVGTRLLQITMNTGLTSAIAATFREYASSQVTVTQDQNGGVWAGPGGVALLNDNGTITEDTIPSPCPFLATDVGQIIAEMTAGLAGDLVRISFWARRVA